MKAIANQSLLDIAIQESGSVLSVFELAIKNQVSITDDLTVGQEITIPESEFKNSDTLTYFKGKQHKIATAITSIDHSLIIPSDGIGAMIIEETFIIR